MNHQRTHRGLHVAAGLALLLGMAALSGVIAVPQPTETAVRAPADLVPASTLFYIEFSQPKPIVQELTALLEGSSLEDLPGVMADFRAKQAGNNDLSWSAREMVSMLAAFFGPERPEQIGRFKGGCFAITGFDKGRTRIPLGPPLRRAMSPASTARLVDEHVRLPQRRESG